MNNKYTSENLAEILKISKRTAQRYIDKLLDKTGKEISFNEDVLNLLVQRHNNDNTTTEDDNGITEYFTEDEYQEFQKRLTEYPLLKQQLEESKENLNTLLNEMEYHKTAYTKQLLLHEKLIDSIAEKAINERIMLDSIRQRNFIEAKEKGLDQ
ncbi:HTH domain-containing protein [Chishuiella sp.]|uniref:HTH domain-containing protein n=1 Tax=Chishuiella sp. TaxID=1969467 RepID=UPI0028AE0AFC|nr:HTH domain-containing protein [Chishuiella sp.]